MLRAETKRPKKLSLSRFMARKAKPKPPPAQPKANAKANATPKDTTESEEFPDHLSDVPSDVDSITRERYLLACQMLKMTMIKKESALIPIEKEYILSLLNDFESRSADGTDLDEDYVAAIERAVVRLETESVSVPPYDAGNIVLPSPATAARAQQTQKANNNSVEARFETISPRPPNNDKNPHTATHKPKKLMDRFSNPCNPTNLSRITGRTKDDFRIRYVRDEALPESIEITSSRDYNNNNEKADYLVRFDGWSFQNSSDYPFSMLGVENAGTNNINLNPRVFTPDIMDALRGFMPLHKADDNFWLRFSLVRDGASFTRLLASVRASVYTLIGVETNHGEVFGSFTGQPWSVGRKWYGSSDAFLWRLKKRRYTSPKNSRNPGFERELEVYPCTGDDDLVQYCTTKTIAVGGGEWPSHSSSPYFGDSEPGIGFVVDGDLAGGETNSCATFANPKLARHASTSSSEFAIRNLEVWSLTPCSNVEDATKMELREFLVN